MDNELTVEIDSSKTKRWKNKKELLHRLDGPAIEHSDGTKEWWKNGERHREDGPAIEFTDGYKEWWFEGRIHREDGPAILYKNGGKNWFLNDILYRSKEEYFNSLSDKAKAKCLFDEDFLNG
jgi:hypothetical protein